MSNAVVWSKNDCRYCTQAKQMLKSKNITIEERNISNSDWTKEHLLEAVPDAKTVPQIFLYEKYIGGFSELEQYFEDHDMWRND